MPFRIERNDITKVKAEVIVNSANPRPVIGGGTDSAVYRAAGENALLEARKKIGDLAPGQCAVTPAFALDAKYIIHTVGPVWKDGQHGERERLRDCYRNSLTRAADLFAGSIAFPLISTGVYGFPKDEALRIALEEINGFLLTHEMDVVLVVFDRKSFELSGSLVSGIDAYIDEHMAEEAARAEYGRENADARRRTEMEYISGNRADRISQRPAAGTKTPSILPEAMREEALHLPDFSCFKKPSASPAPFGSVAGKTPYAEPDEEDTLDQLLDRAGETFQQRLFRLIDERGMDDVTVYKRANIDRKVFSRIRCNKDYRPRKKTAVAFAIALKLDMPSMVDLLSRAEIAFSPSSKFDLIISYFVTRGIYDIFEINAALFRYGQPILGE
ncbi:MAG: macro domain-containing protein [Lachnospiraceae bacterium]|nr:macro domain-containing protein [Lachnospiraceae bacterium]